MMQADLVVSTDGGAQRAALILSKSTHLIRQPPYRSAFLAPRLSTLFRAQARTNERTSVYAPANKPHGAYTHATVLLIGPRVLAWESHSIVGLREGGAGRSAAPHDAAPSRDFLPLLLPLGVEAGFLRASFPSVEDSASGCHGVRGTRLDRR